MVKSCRRVNKAFKIAQWPDVQRICYTATLNAFIHQWAFVLLSLLIPSALTVLQFLAALNRASKNGYIGCAVAYSLLAPQIHEATQRACSERTLKRGIKALKSLGLISLTFYTIPDQSIQNGPYKHLIKGTGKIQTKSGEWKSKQIRIIVLTDRALALWDKRSASKGSVIMKYFAHLLDPSKIKDSIPHLPTQAKMAPRSQIDQIDKSIMIDTKSDTSTDQDQDIVKEGTTTRQSLKQLSSSGKSQHSSPKLENSKLAQTQACVSKPQQTKTTQPGGREQGKQQNPCPKGCSHIRLPLPIHAKNKALWPVARAYFLNELHKALQNFTTRLADSIYERALYELSPEHPPSWPTIVNWGYWADKFAYFIPNQRRAHMIREILPLLKSTNYIPVPSEKSRFQDHLDPTSKMIGTNAPLPNFLQKLAAKHCGED